MQNIYINILLFCVPMLSIAPAISSILRVIDGIAFPHTIEFSHHRANDVRHRGIIFRADATKVVSLSWFNSHSIH